MIKLGFLLTLYLCLSFGLFMFTSFTVTAGILYLFLLLPFYGHHRRLANLKPQPIS